MFKRPLVVHVGGVQVGFVLTEVDFGIVGVGLSTVRFRYRHDALDGRITNLEQIVRYGSYLGVDGIGHGACHNHGSHEEN